MFSNRKGFTLVELIVVMAVFTVVLMITADSFKTILFQMGKITKSEESNIEGVVGLEMLRHDLQTAGFGLPFSFQSAIKYPEAGFAPANSYNDGTGDLDSAVPRAIVSGNNIIAQTGSSGDETADILASTDYLALKGTTLANSQTAQKWTYVQKNGAAITANIWAQNSQNLSTDPRDFVIVMRRTFNGSSYENQMVFDTTNPDIYWAGYYTNGFADAAFNPQQEGETYFVYGIRDADGLRMPFNRADYFVARPTAAGRFPAFCAPNTGVLYKGTVNHANGRLNYIPLLDCVADMQVVFGWDLTDGMGNEGQDGLVDTFSTPMGSAGLPTTVSGAASQTTVAAAMNNAETLRKSLKFVKVYILAQVGRRDSNYQSPATYVLGDVTTDLFTSKTYDLASTPEMRNYRWKVYRITASPSNLQANQ